MPGVGWFTGRLLSVLDEEPSSGGEDEKTENLCKVPDSRRPL